MYRSDAELFVGEETIFSREGTTQGDPLSMAVYALSTLPLISKISQPNLTQTWFADDAGGGASLQVLHQWWTALSEVGHKIQVLRQPAKTWLLVKEQFKGSAQELFGKYGIQITTQGRPLLGALIGTADFSDQYINDMVSCWDTELKVLTGFASLPAAPSRLRRLHSWTTRQVSYLSRACNITKDQFCPLEERIRRSLIPAISSRAVKDDERDVLGLPARMGGFGLANPGSEAEFAYATAWQVTKPSMESILGRNERPMAEVFSDQHSATIEARRAKAARLASVKDPLQQKTHRAVIAGEEKGATTWLTALTLADFGFSLSKSEFRDALHLRFCWTSPRLPALCVCGQAFTVDHALSCSHGGYLGLRHNEVGDLLGEVLDEISVNVSLEPALKPLDGE